MWSMEASSICRVYSLDKRGNTTMKKIMIILAILTLIFLTGCEELTPKRLAQQRVLSELYNCDDKYGDSSYESNRGPNIAYCERMADLVEQLIYDGFFEGEDGVTEALTEKQDFVKGVTPTEEVIEPEDKVSESMKEINDIIGDI